VGAACIGVDVGQRLDPTAIAVAQFVGPADPEATAGQEADQEQLRHLERLPLGTPYPEVATRVAAVVRGVAARLRGDLPTLRVDATGVGQPLADLLAAALPEGPTPVAVYFTHGDRYAVDERGDRATLGKAYLVSRLQALLQTGRIKLPRTAEAEQLGRELLDYEIKVDQDANDRYGAFRVGSHDDLVTALGLAVIEELRPARVWIA
jgi:Terminase RNaseH-like domain